MLFSFENLNKMSKSLKNYTNEFDEFDEKLMSFPRYK